MVDTGSVDDSVEVARQHGALVLHRPWDGDFSAPRNLGLDHINAEWILYIDADEEVRDTDPVSVRRTLAAADGVASFLVNFTVRVGWTPYWEYRVWRHRDDVRFRGRIHETIVPDLRRIRSEEGQRFEQLDLFLQHYGYEGDQTAKHHRNLPILLEQVKLAPKRVYLWNHLGRVYEGLGRDDEAEAAFQHGIDIVRTHGLIEAVDILVYGSMSMMLFRKGRDATEIIEEGLRLDPQYHTLYLGLARLHMINKDWSAAERELRRLIAVGQQPIEHPVLSFTRAVFDHWPTEMLADCLFELGEYAEAGDLYERAREYGAAEIEMRTKAAACRSLASHQQTLGAQ